jgi:hypothetical protein
MRNKSAAGRGDIPQTGVAAIVALVRRPAARENVKYAIASHVELHPTVFKGFLIVFDG